MGNTPQTPPSQLGQPPTTGTGAQSADAQGILAQIGASVAQLSSANPSIQVESFTPVIRDNPQTTEDLAWNAYAQIYHTLTVDAHFWGWIASAAAGIAFSLVSVIVPMMSIAMPVLATVGETFGDLLVKQLAALRTKDTSALNQLIQDVMGEFFGVDFSQRATPFKTGGTVLARAEHIGDQVYGLLKQEFTVGQGTTLGPSEKGASTFLGFNVDFSIYTAVLDLIAELSSFDHADEIRELGANVAQNLGLGRLARRALAPLMKICVEDTGTWALNKEFRPAMLPEAQIVAMLLGGEMNAADANESLARLGYTETAQNQLIQVHQKRFTIAETDRLIRWGVWTEDQGLAYLTSQGYPSDIAKFYLQATQLARMDAIENQFLGRLRQAFIDGYIDADTLNQHLANLHLAPGEIQVWQGVALAEAQIPRRALTIAELLYALENDLLTIGEVEDELTREGFSPSDVVVMRSTLMLKAGKAEATAQAAAAKAAAKAAGTSAPPTPAPPTPAG
jgi:hypothetical protein